MGKTGKTGVLPRFGSYRSKNFFFKWSWSCPTKILGGAPDDITK